MEDLIRFDSVSQYNAFNQQETLHPLVTVIDLSTASPRRKPVSIWDVMVFF